MNLYALYNKKEKTFFDFEYGNGQETPEVFESLYILKEKIRDHIHWIIYDYAESLDEKSKELVMEELKLFSSFEIVKFSLNEKYKNESNEKYIEKQILLEMTENK